MEWQVLFNLAFSALLSVIGAGLGYVLTQIRQEFTRIDKRIDELRDSQVTSSREERTGRMSCQSSLPNTYVTRREYEASQETIRNDLSEIKASIRDIYEILRNSP